MTSKELIKYWKMQPNKYLREVSEGNFLGREQKKVVTNILRTRMKQGKARYILKKKSRRTSGFRIEFPGM